MEILERKEGNVSVVSLSGRLDAYSVDGVEARLDSMIDISRVRLVVSLAEVEVHQQFRAESAVNGAQKDKETAR